ncbi:TetR family transcriptional regulator [Leucobacter luti]|uniref:TetR/AcrR family transcriptional regulator n=1 Tax=Leucobacter luti TaxID=340320 RepID=UPI0010EEF2FB|nr:TetR/AcrR family transcriptional regulator [Leucobacter luti]MCW2289139.1 AcrR family transcriptional regulator [Leucobacter luti]TCK35464.1 TetR family transcriptional regulator [Leucobacter luti]
MFDSDTPPPSTWRTAASGTKHDILVAASQLFWKQGYKGTSTREIAAQVGIQQPSLFHFFANKAAILQALLAISLDDTLLASDTAVAGRGSPAARLHAYLVWDLTEIHQMPYVLAGIHSVDILTTPGFEVWADKSRRLYTNLRTLIAQGVAAGEFPEQNLRLSQEQVAWHVLAHISFHAEGLSTDPPAEARAGADFIIRGLGGAVSAISQ